MQSSPLHVGGAHLEGDAARATDQMLPPAYRARVSNIGSRPVKEKPRPDGVPDGAGRASGRMTLIRRRQAGPYHRLRRMTVRSRTLDIKLRWIKTRRA